MRQAYKKLNMNQHQDESCYFATFIPILFLKSNLGRLKLTSRNVVWGCSRCPTLLNHSCLQATGLEKEAVRLLIIFATSSDSQLFFLYLLRFLLPGKAHLEVLWGVVRLSGGGQPNVVIFNLGLEG